MNNWGGEEETNVRWISSMGITFKDVRSGEDCSKVQMFKVERWGKEKGWILRSLILLQDDIQRCVDTVFV